MPESRGGERRRRRRERRVQWTATPPVRDCFVLGVDQRRRRLGLPQNVFAPTILGVSRSTWSKVFNGRRPPSRYLVDRILARWPKLAQEYATVARARAEADTTEPR